ncbi:hypothetical protein Dimus_000881, partial [Dionaea muscipula]
MDVLARAVLNDGLIRLGQRPSTAYEACSSFPARLCSITGLPTLTTEENTARLIWLCPVARPEHEMGEEDNTGDE